MRDLPLLSAGQGQRGTVSDACGTRTRYEIVVLIHRNHKGHRGAVFVLVAMTRVNRQPAVRGVEDHRVHGEVVLETTAEVGVFGQNTVVVRDVAGEKDMSDRS